MADIERVVKGTPEQLIEILTGGSITIDDITVTKEELEAGTTLFDTGRLDQMQFMQQVKSDMHRVYGYNHTDFAVKSLEKVYSEIIEDNSELATVSAVGFTTLLHNGDTVPVIGRTFIYGKPPEAEGSYVEVTEETQDYTFSGTNSADGRELVFVWYFEDDGAITLPKTSLNIIDLDVRYKNAQISLDTSWYNYLSNIKTENYIFASNVLSLREKYDITHSGSVDASTIKIPSLDCRELIITAESLGVVGNPSDRLEKVTFDVTTIGTVQQVCFGRGLSGGQYNPWYGELNLIGVENIYSSSPTHATALFNNIAVVTLPESLKNMTSGEVLSNNLTVNLKCKDLETVANNWCGTTPRDNFTMCDDWGASINIATAAAKWELSDFTDLVATKLRIMPSNNVKTLIVPNTSPKNIYSHLNTEMCTVEGYTDKTWVQYAADIKNWEIVPA